MAVRLRVVLRVVQGEDPAQFGVKQLTEARGQGQHPQGVSPGREELAQARTAQVLQGSGRRHGADELHAALGCGAARHGEHLLVLQLGCRHTCNIRTHEEESNRESLYICRH